MNQKLHSRKIYNPGDPDILKEQDQAMELLCEYNSTPPGDLHKRRELLEKMLGYAGTGVWIEPPFHANWGGKFCHFEDGVYANFNLTLVDDTDIYIGADTMIGPNVTIIAGNHPISPKLRQKHLQYNLPVHIGANCWIGAGAVILPGVSIGDNSIIGAGSIVTRDIPANVIAAGNPCRVLRDITEQDDLYYDHDKPIDPVWFK